VKKTGSCAFMAFNMVCALSVSRPFVSDDHEYYNMCSSGRPESFPPFFVRDNNTVPPLPAAPPNTTHSAYIGQVNGNGSLLPNCRRVERLSSSTSTITERHLYVSSPHVLHLPPPFRNINPDLQPPSSGTAESCLEPRKHSLGEEGAHTTDTSQNLSRERARYMNGCGLVSKWEVNWETEAVV